MSEYAKSLWQSISDSLKNPLNIPSSTTPVTTAVPDASDTSNIDSKKQTPYDNIMNIYSKESVFMITVLTIIAKLFGYFTISGILLYSCKVAQASLIPTDPNCYPYTTQKPNVPDTDTNIFETLFTTKKQSQKVAFVYNNTPEPVELKGGGDTSIPIQPTIQNTPTYINNSANIILDMIRKVKYNPKSYSFALVFSSFIEGLIYFNYSLLSIFYNLCNQLPEVLIVLLGPAITIIFYIILFFISMFYAYINWALSMDWFLREPGPDAAPVGNSPPKRNYKSGGSFAFACVIVFFAFFIGLVLLLISSPFICIILMFYCIMTVASATGTMNGQSVGAFDIISKVFLYYNFYISTVFAYYIITTAAKTLGTMSAAFAIITTAIIYFRLLSLDMFVTVPKDNLSNMTTTAQTEVKPCTAVDMSSDTKMQMPKVNMPKMSKVNMPKMSTPNLFGRKKPQDNPVETQEGIELSDLKPSTSNATAEKPVSKSLIEPNKTVSPTTQPETSLEPPAENQIAATPEASTDNLLGSPLETGAPDVNSSTEANKKETGEVPKIEQLGGRRKTKNVINDAQYGFFTDFFSQETSGDKLTKEIRVLHKKIKQKK